MARYLALLAALPFLLSGCIESGARPGGYHEEGPPPSYGEGPHLTHMQREALSDGCYLRYSGNHHKLEECYNLGANWRDALAQGCEKRYHGDHRKLRECLEY